MKRKTRIVTAAVCLAPFVSLLVYGMVDAVYAAIWYNDNSGLVFWAMLAIMLSAFAGIGLLVVR